MSECVSGRVSGGVSAGTAGGADACDLERIPGREGSAACARCWPWREGGRERGIVAGNDAYENALRKLRTLDFFCG